MSIFILFETRSKILRMISFSIESPSSITSFTTSSIPSALVKSDSSKILSITESQLLSTVTIDSFDGSRVSSSAIGTRTEMVSLPVSSVASIGSNNV